MTGLIPRTFIDELLQRTDIVDVIDEILPLKKTGNNFVARCPFHQEKSPSFTVSAEKQFYHCFGCGAHGSAISFLMEQQHLSFVESVHELAHRAGMVVPTAQPANGDAQTEDQTGPLFNLLDEVATHFRRQLNQRDQSTSAVEYLKGRELTSDIAKAFAIGYAPPGWDNLLRALGSTPERKNQLATLGLLIKRDDDSGFYDRFRDRVMFPIRDRRGRVIGFGGRVLGNEQPKYLNSPESPVFHKGHELYGLFEALQAHKKLRQILVVEGYMDVVALAQFGITNAVATLGTAVTPQHVERIFRHTQEVVYCFDGDQAGRGAAWRALEHTLPAVKEGRQARFVFLPEKDDPDSLVRRIGTTEFQQLLDKGITLSEFFFRKLSEDSDVGTIDGRAKLAEAAKPLLAKLPDGVFREMMIAELATRTHAPQSALAKIAPPRNNQSTAARKSSAPPRKLASQLTPLRRAIALLLQHPQLAAEAPDTTWLADSHEKGFCILRELLELIKGSPHLTTGALLENWRDREEAPYLSQLAMWKLTVPTAGMAAEFGGVIAILQDQIREQRTEFLLGKPLDQLSAAERNELVQHLGETKRAR